MISLSAAQALTAMILTPSAGMLRFCQWGDVGLFSFQPNTCRAQTEPSVPKQRFFLNLSHKVALLFNYQASSSEV